MREVDRRTGEARVLGARIPELEAELDRRDAEMAELEAELDEQDRELAEREASIHELDGDSARLEAETRRLESELKRLDRETADLDNQVSSLQRSLERQRSPGQAPGRRVRGPDPRARTDGLDPLGRPLANQGRHRAGGGIAGLAMGTRHDAGDATHGPEAQPNGRVAGPGPEAHRPDRSRRPVASGLRAPAARGGAGGARPVRRRRRARFTQRGGARRRPSRSGGGNPRAPRPASRAGVLARGLDRRADPRRARSPRKAARWPRAPHRLPGVRADRRRQRLPGRDRRLPRGGRGALRARDDRQRGAGVLLPLQLAGGRARPPRPDPFPQQRHRALRARLAARAGRRRLARGSRRGGSDPAPLRGGRRPRLA